MRCTVWCGEHVRDQACSSLDRNSRNRPTDLATTSSDDAHVVVALSREQARAVPRARAHVPLSTGSYSREESRPEPAKGNHLHCVDNVPVAVVLSSRASPCRAASACTCALIESRLVAGQKAGPEPAGGCDVPLVDDTHVDVTPGLRATKRTVHRVPAHVPGSSPRRRETREDRSRAKPRLAMRATV
jgi:hypothetical protein